MYTHKHIYIHIHIQDDVCMASLKRVIATSKVQKTIPACTHTCMHARMHVCLHTCMHACLHQTQAEELYTSCGQYMYGCSSVCEGGKLVFIVFRKPSDLNADCNKYTEGFHPESFREIERTLTAAATTAAAAAAATTTTTTTTTTPATTLRIIMISS